MLTDEQIYDIVGPVVGNFPHPGMTLRDYFAANAMPEVMRDWRENRKEQGNATFEEDVKCIAEDCYLMADAMLKARET